MEDRGKNQSLVPHTVATPAPGASEGLRSDYATPRQGDLTTYDTPSLPKIPGWLCSLSEVYKRDKVWK